MLTLTEDKILQLNANAKIPAVDGYLVTNVNAANLQGRILASTAPTSQQVITWNNTTSVWEPQTVSTTATNVAALAGSVGAPSISFISDDDTGWYNPADNILAAATGGTERVEDRNSNRGFLPRRRLGFVVLGRIPRPAIDFDVWGTLGASFFEFSLEIFAA